EEHERECARDERHENTGEDVVAAEKVPEPSHEEWVEREERRPCRRPDVAVLSDLDVPVAVPASPDVDDRAEVVDPRSVPAIAEGVEGRAKEEQCPRGEDPSDEPAPHEKRQRRALTGSHGAVIIAPF